MLLDCSYYCRRLGLQLQQKVMLLTTMLVALVEQQQLPVVLALLPYQPLLPLQAPACPGLS
jgi:hypothetical protein